MPDDTSVSGQYVNIARYYDALNTGADYSALADFVGEAFRRYSVPGRLILDLACGTGNLTMELDRRGYDMTGMDASEDMLSVASAKPRSRRDGDILWLRGDMMSFELYGSVDAAVCMYDSLNYLLTRRGLVSCFRLVRNYLSDGGLFLFDVNSPYKFKKVFADNTFVAESDDIYCVWQNMFDPKSRLCEFNLTFFAREGDVYTRSGEIQTERMYDTNEIISALAKAGFGKPDIFTDCAFKPYRKGAKAERLYFAVKK